MYRLIAGDKGQAVGQLKTALAEAAALPNAGDAQRGLMDQLQGQAWRDLRGGLAGPGAE